MTMDELQALVRGQDLKYFVDPDRDALLLGVRGLHASYRFVISLQVDGTFLQFRTIDYLQCGADHPHHALVLRVLAAINVEKRLVKFAWDASDGEIVAYADVWLEDGTLTERQFRRMLQNFMPTVDFAHERIRQTLESGRDPGEEGILEALTTGASGLPPDLSALLEKLRKGESGEDEGDDAGDDEGYETI
ncbi:MAG TPA: YbjN domain-containing protein [Longimicrobiales bacterium]|nr:YbjN domain-containing protein [Longimicrobiales bacterium]